MTGQILPDDPGVTDLDPPRQHVRRRKTVADYITTGGSLAGAVAAMLVLMGSVTDKLPFVQKDLYAKDWGANDARMLSTEATDREQSADLKMIKRTGLLTLQLGYQQRMNDLNAAMKALPGGSPSLKTLQEAYDEAAQNLQEVKRQLNR